MGTYGIPSEAPPDVDVVAGVLVVVLGGVLAWLLLMPSKSRARPEDIDAEELAAAEQEVRDLDAFTSPEDADDHLPDWGPGVPKGRR